MKRKQLPTANMPQQQTTLLLALELSKCKWVLCLSDGKRLRQGSVEAGDQSGLLEEIERAKAKFGLPADCVVHSCYEAGRDGFWIHRFLWLHQIQNRVFDPSSIEVNRRGRTKKTDRIDAEKLLVLLLRIVLCGERRVCAQVRVPSPQQEAAQRVARERGRLVKERTAHRSRIGALLTLQGVRLHQARRRPLEELVDWQGQSLRPEVRAELQREKERLTQVEEQIGAIEKEQAEQLKDPQTQSRRQAAKLQRLYAIGLQSSWLLSHELFWRDFQNRRQVGACAGLTGSPYDSGQSRREQGISKAGNWRVRALSIELAWNWLRFQPQSELSQWYFKHYGPQSKRSRRIGIVALARKLLVALWKYLEFDLVPAAARFKA